MKINKFENIFIFIILLLGIYLLVSSFLGSKKESFIATTNNTTLPNNKTNYDNYNHYDQHSTILINGAIFYGPNGGTLKVITDTNGKQILIINENIIYHSSSDINTFEGPNGSTATIITGENGQHIIQVKTENGTVIYTTTQNTNNDTNNMSSMQYYGSTGTPIQPTQTLAYENPSSTTSSTYSSTLPTGIPKSQIPKGQEDLYILKSEVVPPVCPACPSPIIYNGSSSSDNQKCPPCEPCGRCPEPSMICKAVPNYNAINNNNFPQPVLNNFTSFGM